jgi:hypothetical protein
MIIKLRFGKWKKNNHFNLFKNISIFKIKNNIILPFFKKCNIFIY